jgi:hypothetical protein
MHCAYHAGVSAKTHLIPNDRHLTTLSLADGHTVAKAHTLPNPGTNMHYNTKAVKYCKPRPDSGSGWQINAEQEQRIRAIYSRAKEIHELQATSSAQLL